jgi:hypothetical protein
MMKPDLLRLREALEASWNEETAYLGAAHKGNPALGQCYPTARIVQHFFPETEIVKGVVWSGEKEETHFWNVLVVGGARYPIDLSWQQFPPGSLVRSYTILDRNDFGDGEDALRRCDLLLQRVLNYLNDPAREEMV